MIHITGDCHGNFSRFRSEIFPEQKEMTKDDYVIIGGDFAGIWGDENDFREKMLLDWLNDKPFTTLFIDGNHENFDRLNSFPVTMWHGGKVHRIREHVIHLMRGQVFEIDGKKIFTFGGAHSHDISGGILELNDPDFDKKRAALHKECKSYRINHLTWWKEEIPNEMEKAEGLMNLEKHNFEVDFIITHCCASSTLALLSHGVFKPDEITDYLEQIRNKTKFKKWFFGHYHDNKNINSEEILIYEQIIRIA